MGFHEMFSEKIKRDGTLRYDVSAETVKYSSNIRKLRNSGYKTTAVTQYMDHVEQMVKNTRVVDRRPFNIYVLSELGRLYFVHEGRIIYEGNSDYASVKVLSFCDFGLGLEFKNQNGDIKQVTIPGEYFDKITGRTFLTRDNFIVTELSNQNAAGFLPDDMRYVKEKKCVELTVIDTLRGNKQYSVKLGLRKKNIVVLSTTLGKPRGDDFNKLWDDNEATHGIREIVRTMIEFYRDGIRPSYLIQYKS